MYAGFFQFSEILINFIGFRDLVISTSKFINTFNKTYCLNMKSKRIGGLYVDLTLKSPTENHPKSDVLGSNSFRLNKNTFQYTY